MNWMKHKNASLAFIAVSLFVLTGTYNAVVINSESHLASSDLKFVKRLDEMYGVTVSGREAASIEWQKLATARPVVAKKKSKSIVQSVSKVEAAPQIDSSDIIPSAAVQEELSLNLVEVINTKKWQNGLSVSQFNGTLSTNGGVIESLSVSLPNGEGVSVSFSEMSGNVFEYDHEGELYSAMMYQVDQNVYMVTLTTGPLEGTRLRFATAAPEVEPQVADIGNDSTNYGNDAETYEQQIQAEESLAKAQETLDQNNETQNLSYDELVQNDRRIQEEAMRAQGIMQ